jgi:ubiquinone/menaquinone biosynthesis C-methylase UbiE
MSADQLDPAGRELWTVVRGQLEGVSPAKKDARRAEQVLARRRSKVRLFFSDAAATWDVLRSAMIGGRGDLLALMEMMDERWVVGDLGCGVGHATEAMAPCVARVIAVDESGPMLEQARGRLETFTNVDLREGHIEALPIDDDTLDVALLFLVAHFISDPAQAMREISRVLKPAGRLVIVDLINHDRAEYVVQLGHVWQGFSGDQVIEWLRGAGFESCRYRPLPVDPDATGPALFVASGRAGTDQ